MTTVRQIVTDGLRLTGFIGFNATPTSPEAEMGLDGLQSLYDTWVTGGMFGRLTDTYKTANYTAKENERVIAPTAITVTFPTSLDDDENGGSRAPRDLSIIETVLNSVRAVKIYDRTGWVTVTGLTLDSTAPLAERGRHGLALCLARHLLEGVGRSLGPMQSAAAAQFLAGISYKLGSTRDRIAAEYY